MYQLLELWKTTFSYEYFSCIVSIMNEDYVLKHLNINNYLVLEWSSKCLLYRRNRNFSWTWAVTRPCRGSDCLTLDSHLRVPGSVLGHSMGDFLVDKVRLGNDFSSTSVFACQYHFTSIPFSSSSACQIRTKGRNLGTSKQSDSLSNTG